MNIERKPGSKEEADKLIEEMQNLIKVKGLKVDLAPHAGQKFTQPAQASGCSGCTVCPCMICW